jgi:hypothetical protein
MQYPSQVHPAPLLQSLNQMGAQNLLDHVEPAASGLASQKQKLDVRSGLPTFALHSVITCTISCHVHALLLHDMLLGAVVCSMACIVSWHACKSCRCGRCAARA